EMQRQKQQDAIARQQHEQEQVYKQQRDAVSDQHWKAEQGLRESAATERIDQAANMLKARTQFQSDVQAANGDPAKTQTAWLKYAASTGVNPGKLTNPQQGQAGPFQYRDANGKQQQGFMDSRGVPHFPPQPRAQSSKTAVMDPATKQRLATLMQNRKALLAGGAPQTQAALMKDQDPDPKWGESTVKNYNDARKALKEIDAQIQAISGGQAAPTGTPPTGGPASVRVYDPKTKTFTTPAGTAAGAPAAASPAVPPPRLATPGSAANPFRLAPPAP